MLVFIVLHKTSQGFDDKKITWTSNSKVVGSSPTGGVPFSYSFLLISSLFV